MCQWRLLWEILAFDEQVLKDGSSGLQVLGKPDVPKVWKRQFKALDENPKHKAFLESLAPIKRFSDPHEVAEAVIWLCSDKASFVVGHTLVADDGACAGKLLKPA